MATKRNILVLSPHPDDESIGPGGTLRKHVQAGDAVHVVFLTSGEKGGHGKSPEETIRIREGESTAAAKIMGFAAIEFWRLPDGAIKPTETAVKRLVKTIKSLKPAVIYVPHDKEQHPDHRASVRLLKAALAKLNPRKGADVLMFEVWTPIQKIDHIEDISEVMATKLKAIRAYKCQCEAVGFPEAFEGLARYRGEMHSWPGGDYAEVFTRLKLGNK
jgi:LmbE family N-acetylglucosaminyl deacetylase